VTFQMVTALGVLLLLRVLNLVSNEPLRFDKAKQILPIALLYSANVVFGLASLSKLNVPMYNTLKRMTPIVVIVMGVMVDGKSPQRNIILAVSTTSLGCIVAGAGDLSFDLYGYIYASLSCLLQAAYLVSLQKTGAEKGLDSATVLFYNSLLSLPPLLAIVSVDGSLSSSTEFIMQEQPLGFYLTFGGTLIIGVLLNYTLFLCTKCNSALTTTIVGVMKGVVSTALGFFLLGGVKVHTLNMLGIVLNSLGGVWYAKLKYVARQNRAEEESKDAGSSPKGKDSVVLKVSTSTDGSLQELLTRTESESPRLRAKQSDPVDAHRL